MLTWKALRALFIKFLYFLYFRSTIILHMRLNIVFLTPGAEPWMWQHSTIKSLYSFVVNFTFPYEHGFPLNILLGTWCHRIIFLMNLLCVVLLNRSHYQPFSVGSLFSKWFKHCSYIILVSRISWEYDSAF